ncbi:TatD DNase family protein [Pseudidiomarina planktonica]|uniref:TatD DNase family protein n=1 Tax=Pseudidiomarina planktonica TaxID=1323738 RepID=A0A1Y6F3I6_9GAMM|nr:TatD family hydrolase [Pseudidiomarina planktonica]RUO64923.1 TatD family deoxyribonuclease [Pseudidiomarina planktonica]SMQ69478.1 TatD DNase family protein [Pseudidiomarina planktonica]
MLPLFDTHCHLDFEAFDQDRDAVVERAQHAGVTAIMVPGTSREQQSAVNAVQAKYPDTLITGVGLHPYFIENHSMDDGDWLAQQLADKPQLVVGEIGLDATIDHADKQRQLFEQQLDLAAKFERPVILHHRKTLDEMVPMIKKVRDKLPDTGGIIHAFSGSMQQAESYVELGFKLGIGGTITYTRAQKTRAVVSELPLSALVLETDAPDMPLAGYQGQRNEPARCRKVFEVLLELRAEPESEVRSALWRNTEDCFKRFYPGIFNI